MFEAIHPNRILTVAMLLLILLPASGRADLVVLQYHHIADDTPYGTSTSIQLFKRQMALLAQLGLKVVPLRQGTLDALAGDLSGRNEVAISFDDSLKSIYSTALPILKKYRYPFTVFLNTDAIDDHYDGYMSWEEVKALAASPLVTLGNHSADHRHLIRSPGESEQAWHSRVVQSLDKAETRIKAETGQEPTLFAYPYGEYSHALESIVASRHWLAYGQESGAIGPDSPATALPRFPAANAFGRISGLKTKLRSRNFPIPPAERPDPVIVHNPPTLNFALPQGWKVARLHCYASGRGQIPAQESADGRVSVTAQTPFLARRFRYNCTYPAGDGHYYWLSQPWVDPTRQKD